MMNTKKKLSTIRWAFVIWLGATVLSSFGAAATVAGDVYATWGIKSSDVNISAGSVITEAVLTVNGISPSNAVFEVYLLDNPKPGYTQTQKDAAGSVFAGYGTRLTGTMVDGNYVCRLGAAENNDSQSSVWNSFSSPFNFLLADGRTVPYTSSLLELIDYAGTGGSFGIGIESAENTSVAFSSMTLKVTVSSYQTQTADQILTFTYNTDSVIQSAYALQFDGVDDRVEWNYGVSPAGSFTMSAWAKAEDTITLYPESTSGAAGYGVSAGQKYLFMGFVGELSVSVGTNGISVYELQKGYMPPLAVYEGPVGTGWNHIAVTYENKQPKIYLNGELVRTGLTSLRPEIFAAARRLGGYLAANGGYGYFKGLVDNVRIWDRVLTAEEIENSVIGDPGGVGPVGDWMLNEGTGTTAYDSTGNGYNGAIHGATWVLLAGAENGLQFDGVDDRVEWNYGVSPAGSFTMSAWAKADDTITLYPESTSGAAGYGGSAGQKYLFMGFVGELSVSVGANGISVYELQKGYMPPLAVYEGPVGTGWNHIAVTYENKQPKIYLNGELVRTGLTSLRPEIFAAARRLGGYLASGYGHFKGVVSEVRIWNRVLSAQEVLTSVSGDPGGVGPVGDWKLDEGTGTTAYDSSGNGYNGTIDGATWVTGQ